MYLYIFRVKTITHDSNSTVKIYRHTVIDQRHIQHDVLQQTVLYSLKRDYKWRLRAVSAHIQHRGGRHYNGCFRSEPQNQT